MSAGEKSGRAGRRHIRYIDHGIQKWMLIALVALEVGLVALAVWALDYRLREALEAQLYRVHLSGPGPAPVDLLAEAAKLVAAFSLVNLLALIAAEALWAAYVDSVVEHFGAAMARTAELDFTPLPPRRIDHEVLGLAEAWRRREGQLLAQVREDIARLDARAALEPTVAAALRGQLEALRRRLA